MTRTGWINEDPGERPAMPVTAMLLGRQERRAGVVETALARSAAADVRQALEEAAAAPDPDERAAGLLAGGYKPGLLYELQQRLGDVQAELESERSKIEKGRLRQERIAREQAAGRITGLDVFRMQDFDEGDRARCEQLERRAAAISRQIVEASQAISPAPQRDPDPVTAASRAAHDEFVAVTRARLSGSPRPAAPRPSGPPPVAPGALSTPGRTAGRAQRAASGTQPG
jgi:hypothetical protein